MDIIIISYYIIFAVSNHPAESTSQLLSLVLVDKVVVPATHTHPQSDFDGESATNTCIELERQIYGSTAAPVVEVVEAAGTGWSGATVKV